MRGWTVDFYPPPVFQAEPLKRGRVLVRKTSEIVITFQPTQGVWTAPASPYLTVAVLGDDLIAAGVHRFRSGQGVAKGACEPGTDDFVINVAETHQTEAVTTVEKNKVYIFFTNTWLIYPET